MKTAGLTKAKRTEDLSLSDAELYSQLKLAIDRIDTALNHFEQEVDPVLIDCYIYELKAAQLRYQFLLRRIKNQERQVRSAHSERLNGQYTAKPSSDTRKET